jgi:hypothetical protein
VKELCEMWVYDRIGSGGSAEYECDHIHFPDMCMKQGFL